ncbi:hypothetical protein [Agromyces humi]|uniref:hypothetical protein n=1 Tax=Agromyces humi TaxID=1766800 RepID=UPI0013594E79|nr:hypothetical protein [Agromyces humi]
MSADVSTFFATRINAARGTSDADMNRALSRLLRDFAGHIWGWTQTACRQHGDRQMMYSDDVYNVISLDVAQALRKEIVEATEPPIVNYYSYLQKIAQRSAFAFFHSSERTGFSSASGASRRLSKINKTRKELTISLGREPSDIEVVEEVNRQAYATRKDPQKQGALVTLADLRTTTTSSLDGMMEEFGDIVWRPTSAEDSALSSAEAPQLVDAIVNGCANVSAVLGKVAESWIGQAMAEPPVIRTSKEIAGELGMKPADATALLSDCKAVAKVVCRELLGIDSPFA